ncbi:MAG TPA: flagellar hook-basal body complex protein FliE [Dongiaceae bacterium]|nr:flagellar hook-basal body complex protein FliE [Dongiaceae bacterium]
MANTTINNAMAAYNNAAQQLGGKPVGQDEPQSGPSFGEVLQSFGNQALATGREDEKQTLAATTGKADMSEVVMAVSNAELTVQTVTAVRDKVVAAYQEVLRMPI